MQNALGSVQTLLVLGGSSDIARATARRLIRDRTRTVILAGRDPDAMAPLARELEALGAETVETVAFDALDTASHQGFVDDVFERHGDIDAVLVAFGVLGEQEKAEKDPRAALHVLETNYLGAVSVLVPVAQRLRRQGHGTIVVMSSVAGERARRSNFVYGSSKAGLDAFCQGLAYSLDGTGANVLIVRPGFVRTKMTAGLKPAPLSTDADTVAESIEQGLRDGSEIVWVPGPLRWVMAILRHVPPAIFRRLPL